MKLTNLISLGAVVAMAVAPIAASHAQNVATSNYMVVRDGKVVSVSTDSALLAGDRVVTRGSAGTTLALGGCSLAVPAASTVTIDANACSSSVKSLQMGRAGYQMEGASSLHGAGWLIALLALLAVISGAVIAGKGTKKPTSP